MHTNHPGEVTGRAVAQAGYGGPEVLQVAERPLPVPGAGEVLVLVRAASVNARDWALPPDLGHGVCLITRLPEG